MIYILLFLNTIFMFKVDWNMAQLFQKSFS